jgi:hypothetical protein
MSAPASTDLIDIVTLPATGLGSVTEVDFAVSCELMTNQLPATPLDPNTNILVAQDSLGQPLIFSIGNEGQLNLLQFAQGAESYRLTDLLEGFTGYATAAAFDLSQDTKGRISLVVALQKKGATATDLFMAPMLSNDTTQTDWANFGSLCVLLQGVDANFTAGTIRLGSSDDGKAPIAAIAGADGAGTDEFYYLLTDPAQPLQKKELPENTKSGAAVDAGFAFGQRGLFFLYPEGDSQTLECTTLADQFEGSESYDFSPGNAQIPAAYQNIPYNCIAVAAGTNTNPISSDLYVGTDKGIVLFRGCDIAKGFQNVTAAVADVHQLVVCEDGQNIVIWAFASPSLLYYIVGKKAATGTPYQWNSPILFNRQASHVAPIRYTQKQANEVYLVDQQENLLHYWQDPNTTIWYNRTLRVQQEDFLVNFTSFTTNVILRDSTGAPLAGQQLQLTAESWIYATINGLIYSLDKDTPATVTTDSSGSINIIQLTNDIAPPELHLDADFLASTLTIYANGKIQKGLRGIQSGADLKNATGQDGKPVLGGSYPDDTLDAVASNVGQVNTAAQSQGSSNIAPGNQFVAVMPKGARHGLLSITHLPTSFSVGMKLEKGVWKAHEPGVGLVKGAGIGDEILTTLGDALHWLETAFEDGIKLIDKGVTYLSDGVSFVISTVEAGLQFVLTIADKVLTMVLKTMVSVFKVVNWILKLIGIDLSAILRWLGHLLGLDGIWNTHKVLAAMMVNGVNYGVGHLGSAIDSIKANVASFFDQAESLLTAAQPSVRTAGMSLSTRSQLGHPANSASGSWIAKQIRHNGLLSGDSAPAAAAVAGSSGNPLQRFITDVIIPTITTLQADLKQDLVDASKLLTGDLSAVLQLAPDLLKTVLDPIKTIILGLLDFLKDMIGDLASLLTQPLNIPFLSAFYDFITTLLGEEEELTVCNAVALIVAIPHTIIWKLGGNGSAPLADDSHGFDSPNFFPSIFGPVGGQLALVRAGGLSDDYPKIGGSFGAVAGLIAAVVAAVAATQDSGSWSPEMSTYAKVLVGLGTLGAAMTFPMPFNSSGTALGLAYTSYTLATVKNVGFPFIRSGASAEIGATYDKISSGLSGGVDVVILGLGIALDVQRGAGGFAWTGDILSNLGGAVADGCTCALKFSPGQEELELAIVVASGVAFFGGIFLFVHAVEDDEPYVINPGG